MALHLYELFEKSSTFTDQMVYYPKQSLSGLALLLLKGLKDSAKLVTEHKGIDKKKLLCFHDTQEEQVA